MSIALVTVLVVLVRDNRRRLRAESDLGDALAFRKAMEDSLITGLRARDLQGRITYVNPAFCEMVGFEADELLGQALHPIGRRSWWRNTVRRQARALGRPMPPRAKALRSVFMRKDGTRFPVLIFEAPLINAAGPADRLDERFHGHQRAAAHGRSCRAPRTSACKPRRALGHGGEMASLLSHELTSPWRPSPATPPAL